MIDLARLALKTQTDLRQQSNIEIDAPRYITLTRTATLAIATTGTLIVWQSEVRNVGGFTWSGSNITIPVSGYYLIDMAWNYNSASVTTVDVIVNGTDTGRSSLYYGGGTRNRATFTRYFTALDTLAITVTVVAGRTMQVSAYGTSYESPFLHIVKV